ncbi:UTP14A family protein [Megaselia abdita]
MLKKSKKIVKKPLVLAPPKSDDEGGDDDFNEKSHKKFLDGITSLTKTNHINKPTRTEISDAVGDEFHLTKKALYGKEAHDLTKGILDLLKTKSNHVKVAKEIQNTKRNKKVLKKKIEQSVSDKLQREVAYETAKKKLGRWDGIVAMNQSSEHQMFPVELESIHKDVLSEKPEKTIKSDLMEQMEIIEAKLNPRKPDDEIDERNLTKEEIIARRREMAYLKIRYQQKVAKFRQQKKIKSKNFRKHEKRKRQVLEKKEQELLEKTDPEALERKLESAERRRVLERASLKHKNTAKRSKNVKASQHNKEYQQELADQLALGRELTSHEKVEDSESDDGNDVEEDEDYDPFNPWVKVVNQMDKKIEESSANYRKYWNERNENEKKLDKYKKSIENETEKDELKNLKDLAFKTKNVRPDFDEELLETSGKPGVSGTTGVPDIKSGGEVSKIVPSNVAIDPNNFTEKIRKPTKTFDLKEMEQSESEEDEEENQRDTIAAAFEDDDIQADFEREQEDRKASATQELDLSMPGWGSWVSAKTINAPKRKRIVLKFEAEKDNRREGNKGNVIVNEGVNKSLKQHLVSDVPFPFKSVREYEASIRAPIGRSFVPESAFKALTRPAVITKKGKMIHAMDEEQLLRPDANYRRPTAVDKRIKALGK